MLDLLTTKGWKTEVTLMALVIYRDGLLWPPTRKLISVYNQRQWPFRVETSNHLIVSRTHDVNEMSYRYTAKPQATSLWDPRVFLATRSTTHARGKVCDLTVSRRVKSARCAKVRLSCLALLLFPNSKVGKQA